MGETRVMNGCEAAHFEPNKVIMSTVSHDKRTEPIVTNHGPVRGFIQDGIQHFLGIPYAAPPVGSLRWRPPISPPLWVKPLDAVEFGNVCAQDSSCFPGFGYTSTSEDCLCLNVCTPTHQKADEKLPVMVLFPGGGFFCGGSNDYNPSWLVIDGNVVFVSLNYRLGIFGFFSHPAINAEDHAIGNYGIMDQQLALEWVQNNIGAFGGDRTNVTIMGESAGGISVMTHMASPRSAGLFHRAIVQSGGSPPTIAFPTVESRAERGTALASAAGCRTQAPAELRALSAEKILVTNAMPSGAFGTGQYTVGLMEDGLVVPSALREKFRTGKFNRVPLLIGVNRDEFSWFQGMMELTTGQILTAEMYPATLTLALKMVAQFGILGLTIPDEAVSIIIQRYPVNLHPKPSRTLAAVLGDAGLISTAGRRTARVIKQFVSDVYTYEFDVADSPTAWPEVSFPYGSAHASELQYIFPLFCGGGGKPHPLNKSQEQLAKQMVFRWTSFARHGTPNPKEAWSPIETYWPVYDPQDDNVMLLCTANSQLIDRWGDRHQCDFWDLFYVDD